MTRFRLLFVCAALLAAGPVRADDKPQPNALTPKEIADGWILLFDGESTFGWKTQGQVKAEKGVLVVGGGELRALASLATAFPFDFELKAEWRQQGGGWFSYSPVGENEFSSTLPAEWTTISVTGRHTEGGTKISERRIAPDALTLSRATADPADRGSSVQLELTAHQFSLSGSIGAAATTNATTFQLAFKAPKGGRVEVRSLKFRPLETKPLFNGKDLSGWKVLQDPKRSATKFTVTPAGELSAKNGPGDLQTEKQFDNFVLQLECKTNGKGLNSGVFFRCLPDQYQQGYEMQIQNLYLGTDRTKPVDFGTGAIYRRVPARKVVSNDNEWFTMTLVADGPHFATWVNGYQTVDWTDDRKPVENARQGLYTKKGHLSIQGHDPTTDLLFRNIRIAELGEKKKDN